ncbi:MAG: PIN domain-containing protein [Chitinophagales bacterium]|nr:PIN domain-containing protein [Chitinophagales bacterium]
MIYRLFIDSDVIIDFFTNRTPFADSASQLLELNHKGEITLYLSALSINNIYYILRKFLGHKKSIEVIESLIDITEIIGTTKKEIMEALKNNFSDFEDAIQYTSALKIEKLDAIITRNTKDYKQSSIPVMTPNEFLNFKENNKQQGI